MPNGGTHGVAQHFLKYHTDLNVRIRDLKVLPGADKNPPDFMTLLNHAAPLTQEQRPTILDALNRAVARGDKLFTGAAKENLDMMFTKLIIHENLPLNAYTRVKQVPLDTDPLMWWKQHVQEFPRLARMPRQHLAVPATSASPERLFSSVGLVKSDLRGSLLDTTLIDVMWAKQAP
jgi:hypothetical protein